ncbi:MAG: four-carbon acid sugar kinase family protein [Cyanobacteriota bacterium]|nr:four-carbon acid sugar kinase family protein [Cyanobacteriota bacterium]
MTDRPKIIVLDDDPTGSQTVHSCLLLTQWDVATLKQALQDDSPIFFVLTNTRAMPPEEAAHTTHQVCQQIRQALSETAMDNFLLVSRSDSTLRGHYPVETDVIAEELGPFDAHFLVPAFFEGGRVTRDSIHYLMVEGIPTPVHETEFARDSVFAYHHSYLPDYVQEKTQGRIPSQSVERFLLAEIRQGSQAHLHRLTGNVCAVVDGETQADLDRWTSDLWAVAGQGKRFLFRSAASLLTSLAGLPPQPVAAEGMSQWVRERQPGVVIVGSHVKKSTEQLQHLLQQAGTVGIEVEVAQLLGDPLSEMLSGNPKQALAQAILHRVNESFGQGKTPVVYTSRQELSFDSAATRLAFGQTVSALLMDIVQGLPESIGFLISKGGITSNDTLSHGLALPAVRLLGQIAPGCSVVITPPDHPRFPGLPVVLFPGNVGDAQTLSLIYHRLRNPQ